MFNNFVKIIFSLLCFFLCLNIIAQNSAIDSLQNLLKNATQDTSRVNLLNNICLELKNIGDYDKATEQAKQAIAIATKNNFKRGEADAYNNIGVIHANKGDLDKALEYFLKGIKIKEETGDKKGMADSYGNIGIIHAKKDDYDKALEYCLKALKTFEEISDKKGMADSYGNIGIIYKNKGDYDKALEFYLKALKIREEISVAHPDNFGNKKGMSASYNNIGIIHADRGEYNKALEYYLKGLKTKEEIGDKNGIAYSYYNIGNLCLKQNKASEARNWQLKALATAKEIAAKPAIINAYFGLIQADSALGNFKSAFEHYKHYVLYKDSVHNAESEKKMLQSEMKHEFEKREALALAEQEKKDALTKEELEKQKMQRNGFIGAFVLMLALTGISYRSYRNKKKANLIITHQKAEVEKQKQLIEEKQKEILDSIRYAKRIQEAMLSSHNYIEHNITRLNKNKK